MKIPARVALPIVAAVAVALLIGGLFLWQIHRSVGIIESSFRPTAGGGSLIRKLLPTGTRQEPDSVTRSAALMQLRQGEIYEARGEWKLAQERYEQSVAEGGGGPALKKLAAIQLQRREYQPALETIVELKQENPDSDDVRFLEGIAALRQGRLDTALSVFNRKPEAPQSLYGKALVALASGDHASAKLSLEKASAAGDPVIKTYAETVLKAYTDFSLFPDGQAVHLQTLLARALAEVNECETALRLIDPVVAVQDKYRDAWIVKGFCEFNTERTKEALTSLEQAYSLDPGKPEIQYFLARAHAALGDPGNAVTFLQYAIVNGFEPQADARELLVDYALELGNTDLALRELKTLAEGEEGGFSDVKRYAELAMTIDGRGPEALAAAKNALARYPDDASALALAAKAALAAGVPKEARDFADRALKIDPTNAEALEVMGRIEKM